MTANVNEVLLYRYVAALINEARVTADATTPSKQVAFVMARALRGVGTVDYSDDFDVSFRTRHGRLDPALKRRLDKLLADAGWYFTDDGQDAFHGDQVMYVLHPNITREINDVPEHVYHVTPAENVERIMRVGLEPRASVSSGPAQGRHNTLYGPRIFVTKKPTLSMQLGLGGRPVSVLQIDTKKISIRLYEDPEFIERDPRRWRSAYTFDSIPPSAITVVKTTKHRGD